MKLARNDSGDKIAWQGGLLSVQPRIRLPRSFDQRSHTYLGYALKVRGMVGSEAREFLVGVGQGAHAEHQFQAGAAVSGDASPVPDARLETAEFYKVSKLKVGPPEAVDETTPPPWRGVPPPLEVYRERGHRRVAARTYEEKCCSCIWGCRMPVEMIVESVESESAPLPNRDLLLRASLLPALPSWTGAHGSWPPRNDLHLGGLG